MLTGWSRSSPPHPGPALLALSAPATLALRTLPRRPRHMLLWVVHRGPAAVVSAPVTALVLDLGGLYALYLTGVYRAARHLGAELMYYGGTVIDMARAAIMMSQWYAAIGRALARARRRQAAVSFTGRAAW